jgi:hypothetical protein
VGQPRGVSILVAPVGLATGLAGADGDRADPVRRAGTGWRGTDSGATAVGWARR